MIERRVLEPLLPLGLFRGAHVRRLDRRRAADRRRPVRDHDLRAGVRPARARRVGDGSGVVLIPLTFGWVLARSPSGQIIARTGRYKVFPVVGSVLVLAGCVLLALLDEDPRGSSSRST